MPDPDVDPVPHRDQVAELAAEIAARLGPERDSEITAHLARVAARAQPDPGPALDAAHAALRRAPGPPADAGEQRGRRATAAALRQLADEVAAQRAALDALLAAFADSFRAGTHRHPDLEGELDALHDRFATAERRRAWTPTDLDVATRLAHLEAAQRAAEPPSWVPGPQQLPLPDPAAATDEHRALLADTIAGRGGPVLDLAAGEGALLRLLRDRGIDCRGVTTDVGALARARVEGLPVERGEPRATLTAAGPESLGAIALVDGLDHLCPDEAVELVALAADKLQRGGLLVTGAADPSSLQTHAGALHLDPFRRSVLHPAYLRYLCEAAGFAEVDVRPRGSPLQPEGLEHVSGTDDQLVRDLNRTIDRLNRLLFAPQAYTLLATR